MTKREYLRCTYAALHEICYALQRGGDSDRLTNIAVFLQREPRKPERRWFWLGSSRVNRG